MNVNTVVLNVNTVVLNVNTVVLNVNTVVLNVNTVVLNVNTVVLNVNTVVLNVNTVVLNVNTVVLNVNTVVLNVNTVVLNVNTVVLNVVMEYGDDNLSDTSSSDGSETGSESSMCTFRASCCSARLSRAQVPTFAGSSAWDRKKRGEGMKGGCLHWWVQGSTSSPIEVGSRRRVFWGCYVILNVP